MHLISSPVVLARFVIYHHVQVSEQFKRDAMVLYKSNEDFSLNTVLAQLGINRASIHSWVNNYGTTKRARTKAVQDKAVKSRGVV